MKLVFATIILTSIIGLGVFGVFAIHMGMQNYDDGCIAASLQRTGCIMQSNLIDFVNFHLNAFKNISTSIIAASSIVILLAGFFLIPWISKIRTLGLFLLLFRPVYFRLRYNRRLRFSLRQKFLFWLALHENSPSAV